jgi:branched-subunit amino acid ABC-type transport system permease component
MVDLLHAVGFGVVTAAILALATVAVTMQFSVTSVPNFAVGDTMTVGAYAAVAGSLLINNLIVEALCAIAAGALISFLLNWGLLARYARHSAKTTHLLIVTFAAAVLLESVLGAIVGGQSVILRLPPSPPRHVGPFLFTGHDEAIIGIAVVVLLSVHLVLRYTKFGKAQRAVADNPSLARISGIASARVINVTWAWSGALTGLAGFVLGTQIGSFDLTLGFSVLLVVFASAVVGGIGQVYGAMLGALMLGIVTEVSALYVASNYKQAVAFGVLIIALLIRPQGLIPAPSRRAVRL